MKKIITLLFAGMFLLIVSASARQPVVTLNSRTNYEVRIDNRAYNTTNASTTITDLAPGVHTINVYEVIAGGIFGIGKKRNLISTRQFTLNDKDVRIDVDQNGQARVYNIGSYDNNTNANGRYGKSEGKGRGHKYGHYKNKKNKKNKMHRENEYENEQ